MEKRKLACITLSSLGTKTPLTREAPTWSLSVKSLKGAEAGGLGPASWAGEAEAERCLQPARGRPAPHRSSGLAGGRLELKTWAFSLRPARSASACFIVFYFI